MENKNIASCSSNNSANCIHYGSCQDCQVKKHRLCVSILPFRLLRDQYYRADSSNMIHKPMCETPASVLSLVGTYRRIFDSISDILQFLKLIIVVTSFTVYIMQLHIKLNYYE